MNFNKTLKMPSVSRLSAHGLLMLFSFIALFPVLLISYNSFKSPKAVFNSPLALPSTDTFSLVGYDTVFQQTDLPGYLTNSLTVTILSVGLVIFFGALAAFFLAEYRFPGNAFLGFYLAIGLMIPIRLGTIGILKLVVFLDLANTLTALVLVYTAQGLPLSVFILREFMKQIPNDLKNMGRIDGMSEYRVFFTLVFPLTKTVAATVAVFTMIPIWNDLWFPLILAQGDSVKTVTLGFQVFLGQFQTDWGALLSGLTISMVPVFLLYIFFSKQLISSITAGAIK